MKIVGAIIIGAGLALLVFLFYRQLTTTKKILSPLPEREGIKVIIISPEDKKD